MMTDVNTNHIRALHPDWEVVQVLCDEVDQLRQSIAITGGLYRSAESDVTQIMSAMTELVHHGDLTPSGRRVLARIIGGGE